MSARDDGFNLDWLSPEWKQRAVVALKETLDPNPDVKGQMVEFLIEVGFWADLRNNPDAAVSRFNANLNPDRKEFFKLSEIWALMKRFDRHQLFFAMADDLGFEVRRKPTEERRQELLKRLADELARATTAIGEAAAELARHDSAGTQLRIHPAMRRTGAAFDLPEPDAGGESSGFNI